LLSPPHRPSARRLTGHGPGRLKGSRCWNQWRDVSGGVNLLVDLTANLPLGILGTAHVHVGLAALKEGHEIGDGLAGE
jgi:hypothetical protein